MIVALTSVQGAPGTTTAALVLAAVAAGRGVRTVLVEADPAGGRLAVAAPTHLAPRPSLWEALYQGQPARQDLGEVGVVVAPARSGLASQAVSGLAGALERDGTSVLSDDVDALVVVDVGRLASCPDALVAAADRVVVVTGTTHTEVAAAALAVVDGLGALATRTDGPAAGVLVVDGFAGALPTATAPEVRAALGTDLVGCWPRDPGVVGRLLGGWPVAKLGGRPLLVAAAATLDAVVGVSLPTEVPA